MRKSAKQQLENALQTCITAQPKYATAPNIVTAPQRSPKEEEASLSTPCWPSSWEAYRIADHYGAEAYDATPPHCRAALKTGLALGYAYYQGQKNYHYIEDHDPQRGFGFCQRRTPAPWVLLCVTPHYSAAARFAAAALCAQLAGVPHIGVLCLGGVPTQELCIALELCGIEDIFVLPKTCPDLSQLPPLGRMVIFSCPEHAKSPAERRLMQLKQAAAQQRFLCFHEQHPPRLTVLDPGYFSKEVLYFCHEKHAFNTTHTPDVATPYDGLFCATPPANEQHSPATVFLTPGCEGFWLHPQITPNTFSLYQRHFFITAHDDE